MEITVHNKDMVKVGVLSNTLPDAVHFFDDEWMQDGETGSGSFKCKVSKKNPNYQRIKFDQSTKLSFRIDGKDYVYTVFRLKEDADIIEIEAIYFSFELHHEKAPAVKAASAQGILWYLEKSGITNYSQLQIGRNEVLDRVRKLEYSEDNDSKLARLLDICASFDAEIDFEIRLHDNGQLKEFVLNIYREHDSEHQGVGRRRLDLPPLGYRTGLQGISRTVDYSEIFNAVSVTGKDGLNFNSATAEYRNAAGQVEFVKHVGDSRYKAPISASLFPAQIKQPGVSNNDVYIAKVVRTEYTTVGQLMGHALKLLRTHAYPKMDFELDVSSMVVNDPRYSLAIGDTWQVKCDDIRDDDGNRLLLEFRVSRIIRSFCNPEKNKIEFRNYRKLKSEVSTDLFSKMASMLSKVEQSGPKRYEQAEVPTKPAKEAIWLNTGQDAVQAGEVTIEPNTEYRYDGQDWQKVIVPANNLADNSITPEKLEVEKLSSVAQDMGEITAGRICLSKDMPASTGRKTTLGPNGQEIVIDYGEYSIPEHTLSTVIDSNSIIVDGNMTVTTKEDLVANNRKRMVLDQSGLTFGLEHDPENAVRKATINADWDCITDNLNLKINTNGHIGVHADRTIRLSTLEEITIKGSNFYTGWVEIGVSGVKYARQGGLTMVDYDVTPTSTSSFYLGKLPTEISQKIKTHIFERANAHSLDLTLDRRIQINADGGMWLLAPKANQRYRGQFVIGTFGTSNLV